ncbi:hypothetical protein FACS189481_6050 [Clostridia bacterium]|nr:hypothetical protein FACS189481_6050 [Clostridia bacterium]
MKANRFFVVFTLFFVSLILFNCSEILATNEVLAEKDKIVVGLCIFVNDVRPKKSQMIPYVKIHN